MGKKENNPDQEGTKPEGEEQDDDLDVSSLKERVEKLEEEKEKLEDQIDPNYRRLRNKAKKADELESKLQKNGFEIDEESGEIVEREQGSGQLTKEEVESLVEQKTTEVTVKKEKRSRLNDIDDSDTREAVEDIYDRLTEGRDIDVDDVDDYMEKAKRAAGVEDVSSSSSGNTIPAGYSGKPPRVSKPNKDKGFGKADTDEGEQKRKQLFGDDYIDG